MLRTWRELEPLEYVRLDFFALPMFQRESAIHERTGRRRP